MWLLTLTFAHASTRLAHSESNKGSPSPIPVVLAPEIVDATTPTPAMREWVAARVPRYGSEDDRMRRLLSVLELDLDLVYDTSFTGTAAEVFESGRFNCLALAHLLVGLGREVGIDTYYVRVDEIRTWHRADSLLLTATHVAAGWGPKTATQLVDIEPVTERERQMARHIDDTEALALHYSNRGAENLVAGHPDLALAWLDRAIAIDAHIPEAWVNRGVALRRQGHLDLAIDSYRHAIDLDADSASAWRNLFAAREANGEQDVTRDMIREIGQLDNTNPYVWLALGDVAFDLGDLSTARHLYGRARQLSWNNADILYAYARLAAASGKTARAERLMLIARSRKVLMSLVPFGTSRLRTVASLARPLSPALSQWERERSDMLYEGGWVKG